MHLCSTRRARRALRAGPAARVAPGLPLGPELVELNPDEAVLARADAPDSAGSAPLQDAWLSLVYIVYCQMLAFFKALAVGVQADSPCPTGEVNRVVNGVEIHSFDFRHNRGTGAGS